MEKLVIGYASNHAGNVINILNLIFFHLNVIDGMHFFDIIEQGGFAPPSRVRGTVCVQLKEEKGGISVRLNVFLRHLCCTRNLTAAYEQWECAYYRYEIDDPKD